MYSTIMYNCIIVSINLIQEQALPLHELTMLNSAVSSVSDHFKVAHIQEHVLPLHDLTMLNSAVSSVQHQITLR